MAAASRPLPLAARAVLAVAVVACLAGPWLFDANSLTVLTEFFVVLTLALMWNLLAGYADIISVGQQGFVGVGAYAFFGFTALAHLNVWLDPVAMGVVAITMLAAAACMSVWTNFDPAIGPSRLLAAFEAVVLGGLGSLWGTLAGGVIIGIAQNFGSQLDASWQILAQHLVFLAALVLRPQGLFAKG